MCSRMSLFFIFSLAIPQCQPALKGRYKEGTGGGGRWTGSFPTHIRLLFHNVNRPGRARTRGVGRGRSGDKKRGGADRLPPLGGNKKRGGGDSLPPPCSPLGGASLPDVGACLDLVDQIGFDPLKLLG